jgi:hypothetical protein
MESKGGETKMRTSGTSIASKRAKEHSNRSSERKVMMKTVKKGDAEILGKFLVRPEVPGLGPEVPGSGGSGGIPEVPGVAEKVKEKPGDFG